MIRVTAARAVELRSELCFWQTPDAFSLALERMAEPHGFYVVSQRAMQFWREAHCAEQFARQAGAHAVRLSPSDPPDFELKVGPLHQRFELVEIRDPSARIGLEFDQLAELHNAGQSMGVQPFDTEAYLTWLRPTLQQRISSKAKKGYAADINLAAYIHAWVFESQRATVDDLISDVVSAHIAAFPAIWTLTSGKLMRVNRT